MLIGEKHTQTNENSYSMNGITKNTRESRKKKKKKKKKSSFNVTEWFDTFVETIDPSCRHDDDDDDIETKTIGQEDSNGGNSSSNRFSREYQLSEENRRLKREMEEMSIAIEQYRQEFIQYRTDAEEFKKQSTEERVSMRDSMSDVLHQVAQRHGKELNALRAEVSEEIAIARKYERTCQLLESRTAVEDPRQHVTTAPTPTQLLTEDTWRRTADGTELNRSEYDDFVERMIDSCSRANARCVAAESWAADLQTELDALRNARS